MNLIPIKLWRDTTLRPLLDLRDGLEKITKDRIHGEEIDNRYRVFYINFYFYFYKVVLNRAIN